MSQTSFRERVLQVRHEAIVAAVNRLLAARGYEQMTVDAVAAEVGIAKNSLYKHFASKEALATAAMVDVLSRTGAEIDRIGQLPDLDALQRLKAVTRWSMQAALQGEMPSLPVEHSALRTALLADATYVQQLTAVSGRLLHWIDEARQRNLLSDGLPAELVLYTLYARACDPVLQLMKASGAYRDEQILDWVLQSTFDGLTG